LTGLLIKLLAGISVGLLYTFYYKGGDTFNLFHDASVLADWGMNNAGDYIKGCFFNEIPESIVSELLFYHQPRALFASKCISLINLITHNNYWLSSLWLSLFSYLGMWYLANSLAVLFEERRGTAAISFLFFPSVVFWSAGILKESLMMPLISLIIGFSLPFLLQNKRMGWIRLFALLVLSVILWKLKYNYAAILIPLLGACFLYRGLNTYFTSLQFWQKFGLWHLTLAIIIVGFTQLHPNLRFSSFLGVVVENYKIFQRISSTYNMVAFSNLSAEWTSILFYLPKALVSGLFRPFLTDASTWIQILAALEKTILFLLVLRFFFLKSKMPAQGQWLYVYSLLIFILVSATILTFMAPNFGTLNRYQIGFMPFLLFLVFPFSRISIPKSFFKMGKKIEKRR